MITRIRPHRIFDLVSPEEKSATLCLPRKESVTSMLERGILVSLLKAITPAQVFEFGTFLGETTFMLAENSTAEIFTLDLGTDFESEQLDGFERKNLSQHRNLRKHFEGRGSGERVTQLLGDSTKFDFSPYHGEMQFILIDGGHQLEVVTSDTGNAFAMLDPDRPACVVWHDYENPHYQITEYLDELSGDHRLFHVEETKYVIYFNERFPF